ncbi:MAG: class I tRNA ligase family protein [Deltaproteobacteria bacterium]|nr:class I tRNA ligase family protein [Deltaproteobacteria bacterium]
MSQPPTALQDRLPKNYDHLQTEPRWVAQWEAWRLYDHDPHSPAARAGRTFAIDTPPPYVSAAHLHTGHAMSYSQAEFVVRFKRMRGYEIFYPMGFDDNGLPTERYVEQKYKIQKGKITRQEFVELCLKETRSGAEVYETLWRALGLSIDWRMTYSTIQPRAVRHAQASFLDLVRQGRLERRADPILWCPACSTALAQADVEAGDEQNRPMHAVRFDVDAPTAPPDSPAHGVIETTRPELVPACVALACHPEDQRFAALRGLRFAVPLTNLRFRATDAPDAQGQSARTGEVSGGPFRTIPLVFDDSVDPAFGTGLMMVCTFGDPEDIAKWRKHGLDTVMILDPAGRMVTPDLPDLEGKRVHVAAKGSAVYSEARAAAVELLRAHGHLLGVRDNTSRASLHERCGTPVEIQVAPQWFIRLLDLKDALLERGRQLTWHPEFMRERYDQWVQNLRWDWNISRQRFYGVPFPVWFCSDCQAPNYATTDELPVDPLMTPCPRPCGSCGGASLHAEPDVMDTWMTSSLTPMINANWAMWGDQQSDATPVADRARPSLYPAGLRVQAHEIIRTWLFYTVAKAHLHTHSLPWNAVMISGWGLDRHGKKMSKRAGNFVDPAEVVAKYGADSLRYWAAGATLGNDLRYLEDDVKGGKRLLTKLWNSTRFALLYLDAWAPGQVAEAPTAADRWIRARAVATVGEATAAFEACEYNRAVRAAEAFFWADWCDNYLEIIKDRFRPGTQFSPGQVEAARQTLLHGTYALLRLFAPIVPFVTEELYQLACRPLLGADAPVSVHVAPWPHDETACRVTVFGGEAAQDDLDAGALLVALIAGVRSCRTQLKIGGGRPLSTLHLAADERTWARVQSVLDDLLAASRASGFDRALPSDAAAVSAGDTGVEVAITPAAEESAAS